jgi:WD40 repeat protein
VWLWDTRNGKKIINEPLFRGPGVRDLEFTPTEQGEWKTRRLAIALERGIQVVDLKTGSRANVDHAHEGRVECLRFGPKGDCLASGSDFGDIRIWKLEIGEKQTTLMESVRIKGHADAVNHLAFTRDGKALLSGGQDRVVMVWDALTGQERVQFPGHTDRVLSLGLMPRDAGLLTIGREGTVKRWRAEPIAQNEG